MGQDTPGNEGEAALPPSLRFLKWLVIVLTLTMIGGVIAVVALLVTRMPQTFAPATALTAATLPASITLPEGTEARALTLGEGWIGVVVVTRGTSDARFVVYSPGGRVLQDIAIVTQ